MTFDVFALRNSVVPASALRASVRQIGAQLKGRGDSDEDELDTTLAEAKRKAYERRYSTTDRRNSYCAPRQEAFPVQGCTTI